MKYINAAEILPEQLLEDLQTYIDGGCVLRSKGFDKERVGNKEWCPYILSGAKQRNSKTLKEGYSIDVLTEQYGLAYSTIKKIIYG